MSTRVQCDGGRSAESDQVRSDKYKTGLAGVCLRGEDIQEYRFKALLFGSLFLAIATIAWGYLEIEVECQFSPFVFVSDHIRLNLAQQ